MFRLKYVSVCRIFDEFWLASQKLRSLLLV